MDADGLVREMRRARTLGRMGVWAAAALAVNVFLLCRETFGWFPRLFASGVPGHEGANHFSIALFSLVPAAAVWYYGTKAMNRFARRALARNVLDPLAKSVDPEMRYDEGMRIDGKAFDASLLFDSGGEGVTSVAGSGVFRGTVNGMPFAFSTLKANKTIRHGCHLRGGELFSGMFLRADAAKKVNGYVLAAPRSSGLNPKVMRERLVDRQWQTVVELAPVYNPEFDRWFWVFASDGEAAKAFRPEIADRLLRLREEERCQPFFSHVGDTVCLALMTGREHWRLPESGDPEAQRLACEKYQEDMALMREMVTFLAQ